MSTETREAKKARRKDIKERLANLDEPSIANQSLKAQHLILSFPQYQHARRISIYLSMPTAEVRTDLLVRDALGSGKKVFVPYIHALPKQSMETGEDKAKKVMKMLRLSSINEYETLERDAWGIPHLPHDSVEGRENAIGGVGISTRTACSENGSGSDGEAGLDMIVVPGVAFDAEMNRMGHGAGFYDSYWTRFCRGGKRKKPFLVGLCLAEQVLSSGRIGMEEWDWRVDAVAVGDGRLLKAEGVT